MPLITRRSVIGSMMAVAGAGFCKRETSAHQAVYWSGWRSPANQLLTFGWWYAIVPPDPQDYNIILSPTTGQLQRRRECEMVDLTIKQGWPTLLQSRATPEALESVKALAYNVLIEALRVGYATYTGQ